MAGLFLAKNGGKTKVLVPDAQTTPPSPTVYTPLSEFSHNAFVSGCSAQVTIENKPMATIQARTAMVQDNGQGIIGVVSGATNGPGAYMGPGIITVLAGNLPTVTHQ